MRADVHAETLCMPFALAHGMAYNMAWQPYKSLTVYNASFLGQPASQAPIFVELRERRTCSCECKQGKARQLHEGTADVDGFISMRVQPARQPGFMHP